MVAIMANLNIVRLLEENLIAVSKGIRTPGL